MASRLDRGPAAWRGQKAAQTETAPPPRLVGEGTAAQMRPERTARTRAALETASHKDACDMWAPRAGVGVWSPSSV